VALARAYWEVFIKTLFTSLREKARPVPYKSVVKLVAATRPHRPSAWDGGDTECGIVHILIGDSSKHSEVCVFSSAEIEQSKGAAMRNFWRLCMNRLGPEKLDIRDDAMRLALEDPQSSTR
jgi:hypothetical protein